RRLRRRDGTAAARPADVRRPAEPAVRRPGRDGADAALAAGADHVVLSQLVGDSAVPDDRLGAVLAAAAPLTRRAEPGAARPVGVTVRRYRSAPRRVPALPAPEACVAPGRAPATGSRRRSPPALRC